MTMNIYSKEGAKVVYTGHNGYDADKIHANGHLEVDGTYTVDHTEVSSWHTDVFLKEVPGVPFNSVMFINQQKGDSDGEED